MKATGFDFTWQKYAEDQKMACDIKTWTALEGGAWENPGTAYWVCQDSENTYVTYQGAKRRNPHHRYVYR